MRLQAKGNLTFLRVHNVGTKYGPPTDQIDVEVVIKINSQPDKAMGFQLRDDGNKFVRQGMFALLSDAYNNDLLVTIDYDIDEGKANGVIVRVALTKS